MTETKTIKILRPEEIKVTATQPTLEELKMLRIDWLEEGEKSGMIDDLIRIVKTMGVRGDQVHRGEVPMNRYDFSGGDNDYVILHRATQTISGSLYGPDIYSWDEIFLVENGEHMREIEYGNKKIVHNIKIGNPPAPKNTPPKVRDIMDRALYIPGDWELYLGTHVTLVNDKLGEIKKDKVDNERSEMLRELGLKRGTHKK